MRKRDILLKGVYAGILIALGGSAYLLVENKYLGAFLFSLGLTCILLRDDYLYTGKVCYILQNKNIDYIINLIIGFIGNLIGTFLLGRALALAKPDIITKATTLCETKLDSSVLQIFIKSILCGILIFLSVDLYKEKKTLIPTFLCISTFILCGFEHSIADLFYLSVGGLFNLRIVIFIFIVAMGNLVGGVLLNIFRKNN